MTTSNNNKNLPLIGKGLFSKVYKLNDYQVLVKSTCHVKECIAMDWHNSTNVFPVIERTDNYNEYIMPYFEPVKSLKDSLTAEHYAIYKQLKSLRVGYVPNRHNLMDEWRKQFETVKNKKYRDALIDMLECLSNYGSDISFECSPRNVAVKNGKLILLDVFFMDSQAQQIRTSKRNAYRR